MRLTGDIGALPTDLALVQLDPLLPVRTVLAMLPRQHPIDQPRPTGTCQQFNGLGQLGSSPALR